MRDVTEDGPQGGKGKWGDPRVPKRGWTCVGIDDLGEVLEIREMCERKEIRYVHMMSHPDYVTELGCGCICSGHMEGDEGAARRREADMKNAAVRRKTWPRLKAWRLSRAGNWTIVKDGFRVTVYKSGDRFKVAVAHPYTDKPYFGRRSFESTREARAASFDAFMWVKER